VVYAATVAEFILLVRGLERGDVPLRWQILRKGMVDNLFQQKYRGRSAVTMTLHAQMTKSQLRRKEINTFKTSEFKTVSSDSTAQPIITFTLFSITFATSYPFPTFTRQNEVLHSLLDDCHRSGITNRPNLRRWA
jgi:hypothetical protein